MRIAVLADAHGNIRATERVLSAARALGPERTVFCGDICGYYYRQEEVIGLLSQTPGLLCIAGNHDRMFMASRRDRNLLGICTKKYGRSYELLPPRMSPAALAFLEDLPPQAVDPDLLLAVFHGSPWDQEEYVYPAAPLDRFRALPYRFVLLGHTHRPMHRKAGPVHIVNPGSCGQPRDHWQPSFALLDTERETVDFHRVEYDRAELEEECRSLDPDMPYLLEVLQRGEAA